MKTLRSTTLVLNLAMIATCTTGCGMFDMPTKMDQSNGNMVEMQKKMDESNSNMQRMLGEMGKTNGAVHLQKLLEAKREMLKPENTLVPTSPSGMLDAGKVFAEEATAEELAQITEAFWLDIDQNQPDDTNNQQLVSAMEHIKLAKRTALQVILGFAPQAKIEEMVRTQIENPGRYEKAALAGLLLRALFLQSYHFEVALYERKLDNLEELNAAVEIARNIDYITQLPFSDRITFKTSGMSKADNNVDVTLDTSMGADVWNKIADRAKGKVEPRLKNAPADVRAKFDALMAEIKAKTEKK